MIQDIDQLKNISPIKEVRGGLSSRRFFERGVPNLQIEPQITQSSKIESVKEQNEQKQGSFKLKIQQADDKNINENKNEQNTNSHNLFQNLRKEMTLKDVEIELLQQIKNNIDSPEPILDLSHKYAFGSDSPAWRKKWAGNKILKKEKIEEQKVQKIESESDSLSSGGNSQKDEMPRENLSDESDQESNKESKSQQKKQPKQKNSKIQEKLKEVGSKILIQTHRAIIIEKHPSLFKYQIYDCYRPNNLTHTRVYFNYLTSNSVNNLEPEVPQNLIDYSNQEINTKMPETINQKVILNFDSNFESGNIDSVYIHNITQISQEYNLLMKVDSNTRGNTYWFYFKVTNFIIGMKYKFNILNFTRSLEAFYQQGMNIVTRTEKPYDGDLNVIQEDKNENDEFLVQQEDLDSLQNKTQSESLSSTSSNYSSKDTNQIPKTGWRYNTCENIIFEQSELPKSYNYNSPQYMSLRFSYTFKPEDEGKHVYFAYAVPYTYTQLNQDLKKVKLKLLSKQNEIQSSQENLEDIQQISPIFRLIGKKDYLDNQQNNQEQLDLISSNIQNNNNKTFFDKLRSNSYRKKSLFDWEHEQITKFAQMQTKQRQNLFESKILNQKDKEEIKNMSEIISRENKNLFNLNIDFDGNPLHIQHAQNFEIQNQYIHYRQEVIAQSMGGLNIYQLTITKKREAGSIKHKKKKIIYIQSRLHAAETHGSLVMNEIINELTQNYKQYDQLLHNTIIKIIPMINPDGVVIGNSRSSLAGVDLNRRWANPNATIHPEIYFLKNNIRATFEQSAGISIFCDLHGHNKQMNCFFYGSNKAPNEGLISWTKTRLLPKIFAKLEPIFNFNSCKFQNHKTKYNTARVVMWNEFKVTNSFTLETSMYGKKNIDNNQKTQNKKFETVSQLVQQDFKSIAQNLLNSFTQYVMLEPILEKEFKQTGGWLKKKKLDEFTQANPNQIQKQSDLQISSSFREKKITDGIKKKPKRVYSFFQKADPQILKKISFKGQSSKNVLSFAQNNKLVQINESQISKQTSPEKQIIKTNEEYSFVSKEKSAIIEEVSQIDGSVSGSQMSIHTQQNKIINDQSLNIVMRKSSSQHLVFSNQKMQDANIGQGHIFQKQKDNDDTVGKANIEQKQKTDNIEKESVNSQKQNINLQKKNKVNQKDQKQIQKQDKSKKQVQINCQNIVKQNTKKQKDVDENDILECLAQYFSKNEFEKEINDANKKQKSQKKEDVSDVESDSQPSCDNVDTRMFHEIFAEALSDNELQVQFQNEQTPKANFKNLKSNISVVKKDFSEQLKISQQKILTQKTSPIVQIQYPFSQSDTQNSIEDIRLIAQRVMEAENITKRLSEKFEKLQKEINRKIKEEKNRVGKILFQPNESQNLMPLNQIQQGILSGRSNFAGNQINFGEQFIPNIQSSFTPKQVATNKIQCSPIQIQNYYQIQQSNFYISQATSVPPQSTQINKKDDQFVSNDLSQKLKNINQQNIISDNKSKVNEANKEIKIVNQKNLNDQNKYNGMLPPVFNNSTTFKNIQQNFMSPKNIIQNDRIPNQQKLNSNIQKNSTMINVSNPYSQEQSSEQNTTHSNFNKKISIGQRTIRNNKNQQIVVPQLPQNKEQNNVGIQNTESVQIENRVNKQLLTPQNQVKKKETIKLVVNVMPTVDSNINSEQNIKETFSIKNDNSIMSQKQINSPLVPCSPSENSKIYLDLNKSYKNNENINQIISRSVNYSQKNSQNNQKNESNKSPQSIIYSQDILNQQKNIQEDKNQYQNYIMSTPDQNKLNNELQLYSNELIKENNDKEIKSKKSGQISPQANTQNINQYYQNIQRKIIKFKSRQKQQTEISSSEVGLNINKVNLSQRDELLNQKARFRQKEIQSPDYLAPQNDQSFYQRSAFKNNRTRNVQNQPLSLLKNDQKKRDNNVIKLQQIQGSNTINNIKDFNLGDIHRQEFKTQQQDQFRDQNFIQQSSRNDQMVPLANQIIENFEVQQIINSPNIKLRQIISPIKEQNQELLKLENRSKPNLFIQSNVQTTSLMSPIFSNQFNYLLNNNLNQSNDMESPIQKKQNQQKYLTPNNLIENLNIQENAQQIQKGQQQLNNDMKKLYMKLNQSQNITDEHQNLQFDKSTVNFQKYRQNMEKFYTQKKQRNKVISLNEDQLVKLKNIDFQSSSSKRSTNDKKSLVNNNQ